ncbi:MAG: hypothetical protein V3U31_03255 [Dehalococcoidia bacterium]
MLARFRLMARERLRKSRERDRSMERHFEALSRRLWPWRLSLLVWVVVLLAVLDHASTYALLELSGNQQVYESGPLARWALRLGGFEVLLIVDIAAAGMLSFTAVLVRHLYSRRGFAGFGRAAFVLLLVPYTVIALAAIYNNLLLTLL